MNFISVNSNIGAPKYKQIVASVEGGIISGVLKKGDKLPSINKIREAFSLSRDTVLMAFNELKNRGIVESVTGKGYYIKSNDVVVQQNIFVLFDELNAFKEDLYNSFLEHLNKGTQVDIFFHHFSFEVFKKLIDDCIGNYNYYVVMPANLKEIQPLLAKLPEDRVFILDQTHSELSNYASIYQNFEDDIFYNLQEALPLLKKYCKIQLVYSPSKQPIGILVGFKRFVKATAFKNNVISTLSNQPLKKGEVYIVLDDRDLIRLVKKIKDQNLQIGKDIGVISYNETLLKEIVEGGITTISTDFKAMGKLLAEMIETNQRKQIQNPNALIIRNSL